MRFLLIGTAGERTRAYKCVCESIRACVSERASERKVREEEEADCENETVTRESWREGCRESVAEEGAMA